MIVLNLLIGYGFGTGITAFLAGIFLLFGDHPRDRRKGARCLILSPVWPLLLVVFLCRGAVTLWRTADWGQP